ncbi:uncharacterized protein [Venturia canescens]|uniref:uncharacterized protein isoform X2 n=1 Tax=Venturia canescens TaxID=32260 RepID=UPI001C9BD90D|nr:uncharacterized protein LOC122415749 isoform X2 [Venturia canescens]
MGTNPRLVTLRNVPDKFPFKPDTDRHVIPDTAVCLDNYHVALSDVQILSGLNYEVVEAKIGDLNALSADVKCHVRIPRIDGYYDIVPTNPEVKPVHMRGEFKLNYGGATASGIVCFDTNLMTLSAFNAAVDFQQAEVPKVRFYPDVDDATVDKLESNKTVSGEKVAKQLWSNVSPVLYSKLCDRLRNFGDLINWETTLKQLNLLCYERALRIRTGSVLDEIMTRLRVKLEAETQDGAVTMPDAEFTVAHDTNGEEKSGRLRAKFGRLGPLIKVEPIGRGAIPHARGQDEFEIVSMVRLTDLELTYDEYSMESPAGSVTGKIKQDLKWSQLFVRININRNEASKEKGRFRFLSIDKADEEITNLGDFDWLEPCIGAWVDGLLRSKGIPMLEETLNRCLNEVLDEFGDPFAYWDAVIVREPTWEGGGPA